MKQKELLATKAAKKNIKRNRKPGSGGARPGSGRPARETEVQPVSLDTPTVLIEAMDRIGVKNRTAYITFLIASDMQTREGLTKKLKDEAEYIAESLKENY